MATVEKGKVQSWLRENVPEFSKLTVQSISKFEGGQSNPTFVLCIKGVPGKEKLVLRKQPEGDLLPGAHAVDREFWVLTALSTTDVPVPKVYASCNDPSVLGVQFYVMDFLDGRVFRDILLQDVTPSQRTEIWMESVRVLARLHHVDYKTIGLEGFGSTSSAFYQRQIRTWTKMYVMSKTTEIPSMDSLMERLMDYAPEKEETGIVHGDFRLENLLFSLSSESIIGVIDWELSTIGDCLSDLAYCLLPFSLPSSLSFSVGDIRLQGFAPPSASSSDSLSLSPPVTLEQLITEYLRCRSKLQNIASTGDDQGFIARKDEIIARWPFYVAFALFRLAAILQGVHKRGRLGNASDREGAKEMGKLVPILADHAWEMVQRIPPVRERERDDDGERERERDCGTAMRPHAIDLLRRLKAFMRTRVIPNSSLYYSQLESLSSPSLSLPLSPSLPPILETLQHEARAAGLWNLSLSLSLSHREYAPMAEAMGQIPWAAEVFNCAAPDSGNMEILELFGTPQQKQQWLEPLKRGEIRSCFAMTEPEVASSDPSNLRLTVRTVDGKRSGDPSGVRTPGGKRAEEEELVFNGRKWWTTGAAHPKCRVMIVVARSNGGGEEEGEEGGGSRHQRHTLLLIPMPSPGLTVVRPLRTFGYTDAPGGHCEVLLENVRVRRSEAVLGGWGEGFRIAQSRLGPGRLHHCLRLIGLSEWVLEKAVERSAREGRRAFGRELVELSGVLEGIARSRAEIEMARLLCYRTATLLDTQPRIGAVMDKEREREIGGSLSRGVRAYVSMIKAVTPSMAEKVIDRAIQVHGGAGVCDDYGLTGAYIIARCLRIADGPDEVHWASVGKLEVAGSLHSLKEEMEIETYRQHPDATTTTRSNASNPSVPTLESLFESAAASLPSLPTTSLSPSALLSLYGLYKHATIGPCKTLKPSNPLDTRARRKWEAWKECEEKGMDRRGAMLAYVNTVRGLQRLPLIPDETRIAAIISGECVSADAGDGDVNSSTERGAAKERRGERERERKRRNVYVDVAVVAAVLMAVVAILPMMLFDGDLWPFSTSS